MARELRKSDNNKLTITDARSGSDITLFYRTPTTEEEIGYQKSVFKKEGKKLVFNPFPVRLKYGMLVLTGFKEGDLVLDGKPLSSDPKSPNHYPEWRTMLKESGADLIVALGMTVFEGTRVVADDAVDMGVGDDDDPLTTPSPSGT